MSWQEVGGILVAAVIGLAAGVAWVASYQITYHIGWSAGFEECSQIWRGKRH